MLLNHQQKIIDDDPKRTLLALGTGSGKTRIALTLAKGNTLVICPKTQKLDKNWERELEKTGKDLSLTVISKEDIKKQWDTLPYFDTLILDECHSMTGMYADTNRKRKKGVDSPKASAIFYAIYDYLHKHNPERIYLLTATPTRTPMAVFASSALLGYKWKFNIFRETFYYQKKMNGYTRWFPKKGEFQQKLLGKSVRKLGYTGRLQDWFDVPPQITKTVHCPLSAEQERVIKTLHIDYPDPLVLLGKQHQVENGVLYRDEYSPLEIYKDTKTEYVLERLDEFEKVIVFAKYLHQIDKIKKAVEKEGIKVYVLTGAVKDRKEVIEEAEKSQRCMLICQSSLGSGWEAPSFRCTIFASASYVYLDLEQARGRNLRVNKLENAHNLYIYLRSGKIDNAVWKALENKSDFHEHIFLNNE